jgi:hypothetical protein
MGTRSSTPDLFSLSSNRATSSAPVDSPSSSRTIINTAPRHILPNDLVKAVKELRDEELDRLFSAVLAEQKRRGKKRSDEIERQQLVKVVTVPLTQGRLNAVRAAFKAGVTPSRIARQFGISQADVRKALASVSARS